LPAWTFDILAQKPIIGSSLSQDAAQEKSLTKTIKTCHRHRKPVVHPRGIDARTMQWMTGQHNGSGSVNRRRTKHKLLSQESDIITTILQPKYQMLLRVTNYY